MKISFFLGLALAFNTDCFSQFATIDSVVASNDKKIETVFSKTGRSKIRAPHGRDPEFRSFLYRFSPDKTLISLTDISFSVGDTALIIDYYFDDGQLIKAKTTSFDTDNIPSIDAFYYQNGSLLNKNSKVNGPYYPNFYLERASQYQKELKRKPIRFPQ